jgi:hypothetical protein
MIRRQRVPNIPPRHDEEGQAISQAPVLVGAIGEQTEGARTQFSGVGNHFNSGISPDPLVPVRGNAARSGVRHRVQPFPTNCLGGNDKSPGPYQIVLPPPRVAVILVAVAEQRDPKCGVGEKM